MKPADFFIGVVNFFSVLVPGVVVTFVLFNALGDKYWFKAFKIPIAGIGGWISLFLLGYLAGHLLHMPGFLLDKLYDVIYIKKI